MAKKNSNVQINKEHVVVKNKKFRKADVFVFIFCLLAALVIWIYAKNVELDEHKQLENLLEKPPVTQTTDK